MQVEKDKVVSFHYKLTLESGETIDSSFERDEPLMFIVGVGQIIPGLEKEMMGLKIGDKKTVSVAPEDAYGVRDDRLIQTYSRAQLPTGVEYKVGKVLRLESEQGYPVDVVVTAATDENVTLDLNHPLAGETLNFEIEIMGIREATAEELDHDHVH